MEEIVYEFLDKYIGEGVNVSDKVLMYDPYTLMPQNIYFISSDNNTTIIQIRYSIDGTPSLVYEQKVSDVVSNFFSVSMITSHSYISSWFKERYNIKNLWDFEKLIAMHESIPTD
jgi:hypothetical protein